MSIRQRTIQLFGKITDLGHFSWKHPLRSMFLSKNFIEDSTRNTMCKEIKVSILGKGKGCTVINNHRGISQASLILSPNARNSHHVLYQIGAKGYTVLVFLHLLFIQVRLPQGKAVPKERLKCELLGAHTLQSWWTECLHVDRGTREAEKHRKPK